MSYVKRNTTLILFFLLLLTIIFFNVSVIYYQNSLTRLNDDVRTKTGQINTMSDKITSLTYNLTNLNEILNIQIIREENLSEQYLGVKTEKEKVESDLSETKQELVNARVEIDELVQDITNLNVKYFDLNRSFEIVLDDVEDICDDATALNLSDCDDYT